MGRWLKSFRESLRNKDPERSSLSAHHERLLKGSRNLQNFPGAMVALRRGNVAGSWRFVR